MNKIFLTLTLGALVISSCTEIDTSTIEDYQGAFILNKGNSETSTISRFNFENMEVTNNLFQEKNNGQTLGAGATAFTVKRSSEYINGRGYISFAQSGTVDMINMETFQVEASIDGLSNPNDIILANETTAYVSCGNGVADSDKDNIIAKIDLDTHEVIATLPVGEGPGKLISSGKFLYIANSGGENKDGNTVTVYDMSKDSLIDVIDVGVQPVDMVVDIDRNIWVYCDGDASGNNQSLYKIERKFVTDEIVTDSLVHEPKLMVDLGYSEGNGTNALAISKDKRFIYYVHGRTYYRSVYKDDNTEDQLAITGTYSDVALNRIDFDHTKSYLYGLLENGTGNGKLLVFTLDDDKYVLDSEYEVGINPIFTTYIY
ncbi:YncE family protein [Carboxylicivirga caseinilyticus]|uniref:YncE family protein n=1 Tax=Carboxylicivirga caseinilyticus TaxID=3417572 RepID=UPI003D3263C7|nr:hypothetical protein [Marinilabiliaceae bacterium A049]